MEKRVKDDEANADTKKQKLKSMKGRKKENGKVQMQLRIDLMGVRKSISKLSQFMHYQQRI